MKTRRNFLLNLTGAVALPAILTTHAFGQAPPPVKLEETDPMAMALGYKEVSANVDAVKYPQHKPEQLCSGCALYQGKPDEPNGPCAVFGGKIVLAGGWCATFAKKPEAPKEPVKEPAKEPEPTK